MFEELSKNDKDIELLFNKPDEFIEEKQTTISIIANRYIKFGYIRRNEKPEIIQHINLRLLDGILEKMKLQYDKKFMLSTYFSTIVNNLCKEFLNIKLKEQRVIPLDQVINEHLKNVPNNSQMLINEEIQRLERIFRLYHRKRNKLQVALKIKYKIPIIDGDFSEFFDIRDIALEKVRMRLENIFLESKNEVELFNSIIGIYNEFNEKQINGESYRHWAYLKINEIIDLLNNGRESSYDLETFGLLFQKYIEKMSIEVK